jgi:LysR family transcriptional regulator, transcriptional activator of nhaA
MEWLNYHHLLYFWLVAKEGGLVPAGRILRLSQPTLSEQIRKLEQALGEQLFERRGRRLVLTEVGRVAYRYADEIFGIGSELLDAVRGRATGRAAASRSAWWTRCPSSLSAMCWSRRCACPSRSR